MTNPGLPAFVILAGLLWAGNGMAGTAASADDLALGFDTLHWGMSPEQVKAFFPSLTPVPPGQAGHVGRPAYALSDYEYAGCRFAVTLLFSRPRRSLTLDELDMHAKDFKMLPCPKRVRAEIISQYHPHRKAPEIVHVGGRQIALSGQLFGTGHIGWVGPQTTVIYNSGGRHPCRKSVYDGLCGFSLSVRFINTLRDPAFIQPPG